MSSEQEKQTDEILTCYCGWEGPANRLPSHNNQTHSSVDEIEQLRKALDAVMAERVREKSVYADECAERQMWESLAKEHQAANAKLRASLDAARKAAEVERNGYHQDRLTWNKCEADRTAMKLRPLEDQIQKLEAANADMRTHIDALCRGVGADTSTEWSEAIARVFNKQNDELEQLREQLRLRLAEPIFAEAQAANRALSELRTEYQALEELQAKTRDLNIKLCDELFAIRSQILFCDDLEVIRAQVSLR